MRSPVFTNSGTCTTSPVSTVAGLRPAELRSPWTPGSVWTTASSTAAGRSVPTTSSRYICSTAASPGFRYFTASPSVVASMCSWS